MSSLGTEVLPLVLPLLALLLEVLEALGEEAREVGRVLAEAVDINRRGRVDASEARRLGADLP